MGKRKNRERDLEGVEEEEHAFFDSDEDVAKKAKKIRKLERKEAEKKKREEQEDSSSSDEDEKKHKKDKKERKEKDKKERKEKEDKKKDKKHKKRTPHESEESSPVVVDSILTPLEAIQTEASTSTTAASSSAPTTAVSSTSQGSYSPETKEWIWNISSDLRLRVGSVSRLIIRISAWPVLCCEWFLIFLVWRSRCSSFAV